LETKKTTNNRAILSKRAMLEVSQYQISNWHSNKNSTELAPKKKDTNTRRTE
jgi:hypothetical protein